MHYHHSMRVQDAMAHYTLEALEMLYRAARRVPADKLDWKPLGEARTVLGLLQECAQSPTWYMGFLDPTYKHGFTNLEEMKQARKQWTTLEACEQATRENTAMLVEKIRAVTDEDLEKEHMMPWGAPTKTLDIISSQYWNMTYHTGQIYYIQTLYGDMEM
jgi:uncharacterized damage-inducible protein DinB